MEKLLTVKEVAGVLNISYETFRKDWRKRLLPFGVNPISLKPRGYRFKPSEIESAIQKMRVIQGGLS